MEDLKQMLDNKKPIKEIEKSITESFDNIKDFQDKLKLVFILLHILQEGSKLLSSINSDDFITILKNKMVETEKELKSKRSIYEVYLEENSKLMNILLLDDNDEFIKLCENIKYSLSEIDKMIDSLARARANMDLKEIADNVKSNG